MNDNVQHTQHQRDECIGLQLKRLRLYRDMTVETAAETIGKSKGFISLVENGKRPIRLDALMTLLHCYQFRLSEFFFALAEQYPYTQHGIIDERHKRIFITGDDIQRPLLALKIPEESTNILLFELCLAPRSQLTELPVFWGTNVDILPTEGKLLLQFHGDELQCKTGVHNTINGRRACIFRNYDSLPLHCYLIASKKEL